MALRSSWSGSSKKDLVAGKAAEADQLRRLQRLLRHVDPWTDGGLERHVGWQVVHRARDAYRECAHRQAVSDVHAELGEHSRIHQHLPGFEVLSPGVLPARSRQPRRTDTPGRCRGPGAVGPPPWTAPESWRTPWSRGRPPPRHRAASRAPPRPRARERHPRRGAHWRP